MSDQRKQDMHDTTIYDDLSLITLKVILEDIDKLSKVIDLKMKQLEFLEEELKIVILRITFLGKSSNYIEEEIDKIEILCRMGI